jgi:hypothetical protein
MPLLWRSLIPHPWETQVFHKTRNKRREKERKRRKEARERKGNAQLTISQIGNCDFTNPTTPCIQPASGSGSSKNLGWALNIFNQVFLSYLFPLSYLYLPLPSIPPLLFVELHKPHNKIFIPCSAFPSPSPVLLYLSPSPVLTFFIDHYGFKWQHSTQAWRQAYHLL